MFVSGLVSLNVHEALAFDGTEICLHPDLFVNSNSSAATPATRTSLISSKDPRLPLNPTMTSQEDSTTTLTPPPPPEQLKEGDMIEIRVWDPRPGVAATTSRRSSNAASIMRKQNSVPLTSAASGNNNNSSTTPPVVRHTIATVSSQPVSSSPTIPPPLVSSSSVPTSPNSSNNGEEEQVSSQIQPALSAPEEISSTTNQSLQYSIGTGGGGGRGEGPIEEAPETEGIAATATATATSTPSSSQIAKDGTVDASSVSSLPEQTSVTSSSLQPMQSSPRETIEQAPPVTTLTTSNSISLPPVFPRSRVDTADSTSGPTATAAEAVTTTMPTARPATKPPRRRSNELSSKSRSRHVREISDMTVETAACAVASSDEFMLSNSNNVTTSPPQQPPLLSSPDDDDEDEDEDDATAAFWKNLSQTHSMRLSFVMLVTKKSLTSLNKTSRTQVSLLRKVADLYGLSTYNDMVTIHKIDAKDEKVALDAISVDFFVVSIKDQFISRGDMLIFQESLIGNWVYEGQRLYEPTRGHQAYAREIRHGDHQARSGIVTDQTTITFRSRSARFIWLVQISSEMYDYASPYQQEGQEENRCDIYFDKLISFLRKLFGKWKELEVTHSLTVVLFSRTFIGTAAQPGLSDSIDSADYGGLGRDVYGRKYEDHFRIIIENETAADWDSLIVRIKEAFVRYPSEVEWNLETGDAARRPSSASQGNVLEAINVSLNLLQYHYLDRDLHRTGNSLFVISAGNGIMEVDKGLAGITYQRMMDNGIGSDMLSLALPPLHIAPFFLYVNMYQQVETVGVDASESYYEVPHWMNLSFVSYDSDNTVLGEGIDMQLSKKIEEKQCMMNPAGLPIAPNGFLLPRSKAKTEQEKAATSPLLRPTSFSVHGNVASSPAKKPKPLTQERQLIAGRDFQDILEACRPRHTNVLPSALQALIEIHESSKKELKAQDDSGREEASAALGDRRGPLEWGSMDTSDATLSRGRSASLGQEPSSTSPISPRFASAMTPPKVDELDFADKSSQSSSFASQVSSYLLGVSFDRPFLSPQGQLQRCPSLDVYVDEEQEPTLEPFEATDETRINPHSIESLRKVMRSFDSVAATVPSSPLLVAQTDHPTSQAPEALSSNGPKGIAVGSGRAFGSGSGGIGAALTQYRASSGGIQPRNDISADGTAMQRISSTPGLSGISLGLRQFSDMGPRGLSPLLLPPVLSFSTANTDQPTQDPRGTLVRDASSRRGSGGDLLNFSGPFVSASLTSKESRRNHQGGFSLSSSPPIGSRFFGKKKQDTRISQKISTWEVNTRSKPSHASRRKKAFNPFRQQDEDEVLATNSHNRRRWSHVFAMGELEFKRRNGPNIKSLTAPAILPLFVGYFPTQSEIDHAFTFSITNITLTEFDRTYYSSNKDLLMEMVRQRLTQDFQLVPPSHVNASNLRRETLRDGLANRVFPSNVSKESAGTIRQFLSMGHRLQVLTYDPGTDIIEITRYDLKKAQSPTASETVKYHYLCFCAETGQYVKVVQNFEKYPSSLYNWNKVDRIICGDEDREMREGMRFRRIMFGLIPPDFHGDICEEQAYISKFLRLLEYLNKLREKDDPGSPELNIKVVSNADIVDKGIGRVASSTPGIARNSMKRFYVELNKGKRGSFEWMEVVVDSTFDTSWSYRIMFHWLVASSNKVDAQVQLLHRRCNQYGLDLKRFPQITVSRNVFVNPFKAPYFRVLRDQDKIGKMDEKLSGIEYIHDGVFYTDAKQILDCVGIQEVDLGSRRWNIRSSIAGKQFVHRSGTLFVRLLSVQKNCMIIIAIGNYLLIGRNPKKKSASQGAFRDLIQTIDLLENDLPAR